jgi:hypothetical protein
MLCFQGFRSFELLLDKTILLINFDLLLTGKITMAQLCIRSRFANHIYYTVLNFANRRLKGCGRAPKKLF